METLSLAEAEARLCEIAEDVERNHRRVNITRDGRSFVALISAADLESLEATLELLSDPDAMACVAQAQADMAAGRETTHDEMAALMRRRGQGRPA